MWMLYLSIAVIVQGTTDVSSFVVVFLLVVIAYNCLCGFKSELPLVF